MTDEEKKAIEYFGNLRTTIDESYMLFDEEINVKCGKETIKQISIILNLIKKQDKRIKELEKENRKLKVGLNNGLDKNKKDCFYEDGHTGKCLGYSFFNDDELCIYCQTCDAISIKEDD